MTRICKRDRRDTVPVISADSGASRTPERDKRDTVPIMATALAMCLMVSPAWGHTFPPVHSVVVQVEGCEVALLVGYTAGSGASTERVVARVVTQPKSRAGDALRKTLTAFAMAPIAVTVDGKRLVPTGVRAKVGFDGGGTRPVVVVLATFALGAGNDGGGRLVIWSTEPRTTRISWQDGGSGRIVKDRAPTEGRWFTGVASFLLPLGVASGGTSCSRIPSGAAGPGTGDLGSTSSMAGSSPPRPR